MGSTSFERLLLLMGLVAQQAAREERLELRNCIEDTNECILRFVGKARRSLSFDFERGPIFSGDLHQHGFLLSKEIRPSKQNAQCRCLTAKPRSTACSLPCSR